MGSRDARRHDVRTAGREAGLVRLHSGDPHGLVALAYGQYDKSYAVEQVKRLLSLE